MQFNQPDTIVPNLDNPQSLNRYAYVLNNPIRYNDPTGHMMLEGNDSGMGVKAYKYVIKKKFKWHLKGAWSQEEVKTIYQTGNDILAYANDITGGNGLDWMNEHLGNINIRKNLFTHTSINYSLPGNIILGANWVNNDAPDHWLAHELGHTWDMSSGNYLGIGGGVGDDLMWAVWGDPRKSLRVFRYKSGDPAIPSGDARWLPSVNGGYGNGSVNDYAAEAFSWSIYNPDYLPLGSNGVVAMVVNQTIIQQANEIP